MITLNLRGGLGSQLFQLCTLISHSIKHSKSFIIPYSDKLYSDEFCNEDSINKTYWETLFDNLKPYTSGNGRFKDIDHINQLLLTKHPIYKETSFNYKIIDESVDNVCFDGKFQSFKYFNHYKDKLILAFNIAHKQLLIQSEYFEYLDKHNIASMSISMCDEDNNNPFVGEDYYDEALALIPVDYKILVFYNKPDKDGVDAIINNLKMKHQHDFVYVNSEIEDWKQMLLMSLCRVNIIANTNFSWWGAYLNKDTEKVYYPSVWFNKDCKDNTKDLFLPEWEMIEI